MRNPTLSVFLQFAGLFAFSLGTTALATDPALDAAFASTISPGITPESYPTFDGGTGAVNAVALQSDGKILVGGNVSRYKAPPAGSPRTSLKRLNADGTLDTAFDALASTLADTQGQTEVNKLLVTSADKVYVGGVFQSYGGEARSGILRLNSDGTLDTGFSLAGVSNYSAFGVRYVLAIAEQTDGKVLVGGGFNRLTTSAGSVFMNSLARLNSDGTRDNSFDPAAALSNASFVGDIAVLPNRQILVAGGQNRAGGGSTPMLLRLNENGSLDASFSVNWSSDYGDIDELLVLPDGRIVIGGDFQFAGSSTHSWVACLNANGTLDNTFMANLGSGPNGWVGGELALQPDGTILAGGIFSSWNGQPRASIARLLPDGALDNALNVQPYTTVQGQYLTHTYSFAVQPDGKVVMGGWFSRVTDPAVETYNLARVMNEYDATGAGTLRMVAATASTTELESSITLPVSRFGGLNGAVSVSYSITAGSAVAGTDYTPVSGTLNWAAGEGGLKNIVVPILPDAAADGSRTFTVTLSGPTGGATLPGANASTVVTILDDEAAPAVVTSPQSTSLEQGGSFTLRVGYESVLAATVQWQRDTGSGFSNISGATGLTYTVNVADPLVHAGSYRAVVTNTNGSANSGAATVTISVPAGSVVTTFAPPAATQAAVSQNAIALDASGRHLILSSTGLRRMNADGTLEATTTFGVDVSGATQLLVLPNGKILIGGNMFGVTHLPSNTTPSTGTRVIRINNDATGTVDAAYQPTIPGVSLFTLAAGAGGKYYTGASANSSTVSLLRFLEDGTQDTSFVSALPQTGSVAVYAIKELPDGKVLVSYSLNTGGTTYRLSRLTSTGALDTTFGTGGTAIFGSFFNSLDLLPDGRIAATARFSNAILANHQQFVSILKADGTPDPAFKFFGVFDLNYPMGVKYRDGRLLVWGTFTTVNGQPKRGLVRLNLDGSVDNTFSIGAGADNGVINAAQYTATGDIFIAGTFTSFKGVPRNRAALLVGNPHIAALGFDPTIATVVEDAAPVSLTLRRYGSSTGAVSVNYATVDATAVGGTDFTASSGTVSWADGDATDKTITLNLLDNANAELVRSFGVTLTNASGPAGPAAGVTVTIVDDDTPVNITTQPVASTTIYDTQAFTLSVAALSPSTMTYQWYRNGQAIAGATSASYNVAAGSAADSGVYHVRITNAAGTFLSTPSIVGVRRQPGRVAIGQTLSGRPTFNSTPVALAALNDGGVLVGGSFTTSVSNNVPRDYLIRVRPDGTTDPTFNLALNNAVSCMTRQTDGKILIGGSFTTPGGATNTTTRLVRLNADLSLDTAFNSAVGAQLAAVVNDVVVQPDGAVVVATGGVASSGYVMRFTSAGALDTGFGTGGSVITNNNQAFTLAVLPDGDILVAGFFTNIANNATAKFRLARLNSDGTVDNAFTNAITGGSGQVNDIQVMADGRIVAAGSFSSMTLCQVSDTGGVLSNMGGGSQAYRVVQAPGGKLIVTQTSTTSSARVYRMLGSNPFPTPGSSDGDASFSIGTGPDADPRALAVGLDGSVWVAGGFITFNGVATGGIVRLNGDPLNPDIVAQPAATGVAAGDTAFIGVGAFGTNLAYQWYKGANPLTDGVNISGATGSILAISNAGANDAADYSVVVTNTVSGATVTSSAAHLYLLGAPVVHADVQSVTVDVTQNATLSAQVFALSPATYVWRRNGVVITDGGRFSGAGTLNLTITGSTVDDTGAYTLTVTNGLGQATTAPGFLLVRPVPHERAALTAALASSVQVNVIHPLPDGSMLVGANGNANFTGGAGGSSVSSTSLALVRADGSYDNSVVVSTVGAVNAIARQSDGKWIIGGNFGSVNGVARPRVARLNADFTLDTTFAPPDAGPNNAVNTLAVDAAGKIWVGGTFTQYDGIAGAGRQYLARLLPDGTRDSTFTLLVSSTVNKVLPLADGGVLVGGLFSSPNSVIRLAADGSLFAGFSAASLGSVNDLALTPDGSAFYVGSTGSPYLRRRLLSTGAEDSAFASTPLNNNVARVAVQADGRVVLAGSFATPTFSPLRLLPNGERDLTFTTAANIASNQINAITVAASGHIWLGGSFNITYGSTSATRLLVLNGDVPALSFAIHPLMTQVEAGQTATFTAKTVSTAVVSYRWYKGADMVLNGGRISGATSETLTITNVSAADEGLYTLRATTTQAGTLSSLPAELVLLAAPEILAAPVGGTFEAGVSRTLAVTARGAGTLGYQWFKGNAAGVADISGATSASYTLATPTLADTSYYGVRVTNGLGSAQSTPVLLRFATYASGVVSLNLPVFSGALNKVIPLADGSFIAAGGFTTIQPPGQLSQTRRYLARILTDGTFDTNFTAIASTSSSVVDAVRDSTGRLVIVGNFTSLTIPSTTRYSVARVTAAGSVDSTFSSPLTASLGSGVSCVAVDASDNIFVGGSFTNFAGDAAADNLVKLSAASGAIDTSFRAPSTLGTVNKVLVLGDGKLLVAGQSSGLVRLTSAGALDATFSYSGNTIMEMQPVPSSTDFIVSGTLSVQRITANGALVTPWPATGTSNGGVTDMLFANGGLFAGGSFSTYNGINTYNLAFLNLDGTRSTTFNHGTGFDSNVNTLALDGSGRLWVGGAFQSYRGATVSRLVVLNGVDTVPADPGPPIPPDPMADYLAANGVPEGQRGETDDPDKDGLSNLLEYALNLPPNVSSAAGLPTTGSTPPNFTLTYRRFRAELTYVVQQSDDLSPGSWTTVGVDQGTPLPDGTTTASIPLSGSGQFLRLSVSR